MLIICQLYEYQYILGNIFINTQHHEKIACVIAKEGSILILINQLIDSLAAMTQHSSIQISHEENTNLGSRTLHSEVALSEERMKLREFAHRKFMPAINRANDDDNKQPSFTSSASKLGTAGWILTELALRVAELSEKRS